MDERTRQRLGLVAILLVAFAAGLIYRLVVVQVVEGAGYDSAGLRQRVRTLSLPAAPRGAIWERGDGLLAGNRVRYGIIASPPFIEEDRVDEISEALAPILGRPAAQIAEILRSGPEGKRLASDLTPEQVEAIRQLEEPGIFVEESWERTYPRGSLTAHVVGFFGGDEKGHYGLEAFYDGALSPTQAEAEVEADGRIPVPLPLDEGVLSASMPGEDLRTTLDLAMQAVAVEELERGLEEFGAERGVVIVMNPRTGAILAMAVLPSYDPERYYEYAADEDLMVNHAISLQYEPGSVFKIVTVGAALDSGAVTPDATYVDGGSIECGGVVVRNWDGRAWGQRTVAEILIHSLNVGAAWLTCERMPPELFYAYVRRFGFGVRTGVDLAGEIEGRVHYPGTPDWEDAYLATNAYGQGIAVTPIQMIAAVAAVANDGRLMQPYLVEERVRPDGTVLVHRPTVRAQPLSAETAHVLSEILVRVVEEGATRARVPGYRVAGKTGTASIPLPWTEYGGPGYDRQGTIASFVGFGPVPDPQLVILVRLDRPTASQWGSETAAVVFSRLAGRLLPMLGIPPDQ